LERFAKFPIATSFDENSSLPQPRLSLMSVDVTEGAAEAFEGYEREDGSRKSEYGKYITQAFFYQCQNINDRRNVSKQS
jgi:NTE family protein